MSACGHDEDRVFERTAEVVRPLLEAADFDCSFHSGTAAAATCVRCGVGLCEACFQEALPEVVCRNCLAASTRKKLLRSGLRSLRLPVLWVVLCVTIAGVAYWRGVGNPNVAALTAQGLREPWYHQKLGLLYLAKASRENQRAAALRVLHKPEAAAQWSRRAALTFTRAANYWAGRPVHDELKVGEAVSLVNSGAVTVGLRILTGIKMAPTSPAYPAYLYYLGQARELTGERAGAMECYRRALKSAEEFARAGKSFDTLVTLLSGNQTEGKVIASVRQICGLNLNYADLQEKLSGYDQEAKTPEAGTPSGLRGKGEVEDPTDRADDDFKVEILDGKGKR